MERFGLRSFFVFTAVFPHILKGKKIFIKNVWLAYIFNEDEISYVDYSDTTAYTKYILIYIYIPLCNMRICLCASMCMCTVYTCERMLLLLLLLLLLLIFYHLRKLSLSEFRVNKKCEMWKRIAISNFRQQTEI